MSSVSYPRLFSLPGRPFVVIGALARLPLAMSQLGTLLLVSSPLVAGRLGPGGLAAGAVAAAIAVGSPLFGALTDRFGQRWVMLVQALVAGGALVAEGIAARAGAPWQVVALVGALAGLFMPQIGTMARVRWRAIGARHRDEQAGILETSFAWEGAVDEASFALGPALVGVLAVAAGPVPALLVAGTMLVVLGSAFAVHPTSSLVPGHPRVRDSAVARQRLWNHGVVSTVAGLGLMGMVFGSVQTGTTSLATAAGKPGLAGLLHALLSVGSATAGLLLPRLARRLNLVQRWRLFSLGLFVLALPLLLVDRLGWLVPVLLVLGFAAAPYMITLYSVAERVSAPAHIGTVMTMLAAMTSLGYAVGTSVSGRLADWGGATPAFAVTVVVGLVASVHAAVVAARVTPVNH